MNVNKKIILGTANFNKDYGIKKKKIDKKELKKILNLIKENEIEYFDTADNYDNYEILRGLPKKTKIISKINTNIKYSDYRFLENKIHNLLKYLNQKKFYAILIHDTNFYKKKIGIKIYKNLFKLKKKGLINKVGLSVYFPINLLKIVKTFKPDIIQAPFNVFDNRLIDNNLLSNLKKKNIEIHARSIFLQGLLVNRSLVKKKKFHKFKYEINDWFKYIGENKFDPTNECLKHVLNEKIDKIVIGFDRCSQIKKIFNSKLNRTKIKNYFNLHNKNLIDPRKW